MNISAIERAQALPFGAVLLAAALAGCGSSTAVPASGTGGKNGPPDAGQEVGTAGQSGGAGQGSTAGQGGAGPTGVAGQGGSAGSAVNTCGPRGGVNDQSAFYGASSNSPYEGPAIVERSAPTAGSNELVLAFSPTPDGGAGELPLHVLIQGLPAKATFPIGAKVWLTKSAAPPVGFGFPPPWWYSVRDKKDGRLLLAAEKDVTATLFAPLTFDGGVASCTTAYDDGCGSGTATYSHVGVHGDTTVAIEDGQSATVPVGGIDYTVGVMSRNITLVGANNRCADYFGPTQGFAASAAIADTTSLAGTFDAGAPVACALENADVKQVGFSFYDVAFNTPYDGRVVYAKTRDAGDLECFDFTTTLTNADGAPALLEFCVSAGLFPTPAVGQELWVTTPDWRLAALKSSKSGPLLLAALNESVPFDATTTASLQAALGIATGARQRCPYAAGAALWEATFGTTSPVVLGPSGHATPIIGGKTYDAWMSQGGSTLGIAIVAR